MPERIRGTGRKNLNKKEQPVNLSGQESDIKQQQEQMSNPESISPKNSEQEREEREQEKLKIKAKIGEKLSSDELIENKKGELLKELNNKYSGYIELLSKDRREGFNGYLEIHFSGNLLNDIELYEDFMSLVDSRLNDLKLESLIDAEGFLDKFVEDTLEHLFLKKYRENEPVFKFILGLYLLSDQTIIGDVEKEKKVKEFLKTLRSEDIIKYWRFALGETEEKVIQIEAEDGKITRFSFDNLTPLEGWLPTLLSLSFEALQSITDKAEILRFITPLEKKIKNLKHKLEKEIQDLRNQEQQLRQKGENDKANEIFQKINSLSQQLQSLESFEKYLDGLKYFIDDLGPEDLQQMKEKIKEVQELIDRFEEAITESKKTGKKFEETEAGKKFIEGLKKLGPLGAEILQFLSSAGMLWFAFIGFFLPVYLIEKVKKQIPH
jgi:hypothetical protein